MSVIYASYRLRHNIVWSGFLDKRSMLINEARNEDSKYVPVYQEGA